MGKQSYEWPIEPQIDTSDIPEADEEWFKRTTLRCQRIQEGDEYVCRVSDCFLRWEIHEDRPPCPKQ